MSVIAIDFEEKFCLFWRSNQENAYVFFSIHRAFTPTEQYLWLSISLSK